MRPIETQDIHYSRRVRELAGNAGVDLEDANRTIRDFSAGMGMPIEEVVEHMIGALEYINNVRNPCSEIVLDSLTGYTSPEWLDEEPKEKVNWQKEGF